MEKLNNQKKVDSEITSRYTIVLAVAKRARQIIDGANPLTYAPTDRAVSIAVKELDEGKLIIKADPERLENSQEHPVAAMYYPGISSVSKDDLREDFKDRYTQDIDDDEDDDNYKNEDDDYRDSPYKDEEDEDDLKDEEDDYKDDDYKGGSYKEDDYKDDEYHNEEENSFNDDENYE